MIHRSKLFQVMLIESVVHALLETLRHSMHISCKWNITIGKCLVWLIDLSPPAMFVFVEGTGHLSLKLMMRLESWCQTAVTAWQSAAQRVYGCGWCVPLKCECTYMYMWMSVYVSVYVILYLARGIPRKVMNPVERDVTYGMIDMRSYFMGAAYAC